MQQMKKLKKNFFINLLNSINGFSIKLNVKNDKINETIKLDRI